MDPPLWSRRLTLSRTVEGNVGNLANMTRYTGTRRTVSAVAFKWQARKEAHLGILPRTRSGKRGVRHLHYCSYVLGFLFRRINREKQFRIV